MADSPKRGSQDELLSVAQDRAWRFCAYSEYDKEPAKAIKSLKKRCAGFAAEQYQDAFDQSVALYEAVQELLREKSDRIWAAYKAKEAYQEVFDEDLAERFPEFPRASLASMVGMSFYYWHLR